MIRNAKKADFPQIYNLYKYFTEHLISGKPERYSLRRITQKNVYKEISKAINDKNSKVIVYEIDGKIAAYGIGIIQKSAPFLKESKEGDLYQISVAKEYQNKGIGKGIANHLVDWMKKKNVKMVYGLVDSKNEESRRVWGKIGFKEELIYIAKEIN